MNSTRQIKQMPFTCGFALVELIVAIALMAGVTAIVFATWTHIDRHIYTHQRTSALRLESGRIIGEITNSIRRSQAVIRWDNSSVRFVSPIGNDTVEYSFDGSTLEKNGAPVSFVIPRTTVSVFSIENINKEDESTPLLLQITLTVRHGSGASATERSTVLAQRLSPRGGSNDIVW